jgi:enoyl-CoA hydratase/carnithine racemase
VDALAKRIALWPAESINAAKQAVYESIDLPIEQALKSEAYWLYQATSQTPAIKRFKWADEQGAQFDMDNQRRWENMLVDIQDINE